MQRVFFAFFAITTSILCMTDIVEIVISFVISFVIHYKVLWSAPKKDISHATLPKTPNSAVFPVFLFRFLRHFAIRRCYIPSAEDDAERPASFAELDRLILQTVGNNYDNFMDSPTHKAYITTAIRLRYDDTTTHSTTADVIEITICVRFVCDTTTIRLRRKN